MDSFKRAIKFQNMDLKTAIGWFWGIIIPIDLVSFLLIKYPTFVFGGINFGMHINDSNIDATAIAAANIIPILIYFISYSYSMYYEYFPVSLGFSMTRKDFYKTTILENIKVAFIFSIIQSILMKIDLYAIKSLGKSPIVDFKIINTETDNILFLIISLFIVIFSINSMINLLAVINYKLGFKFWIIVGIISSFSAIFIGSSVIFGSIYNLISWIITTKVDISQFVKLIVMAGIMYMLAYIFFKDMVIKNKIV